MYYYILTDLIPSSGHIFVDARQSLSEDTSICEPPERSYRLRKQPQRSSDGNIKNILIKVMQLNPDSILFWLLSERFSVREKCGIF